MGCQADPAMAACGQATPCLPSISPDSTGGVWFDLGERVIVIEGQPNLAVLLEELGVEDADEAAAREVETEEPVVLSALLLRRIWNAINTTEGLLRNVPAGQRLLAAGADQDDLIRLARCAAYEIAFDLLFAFSDGIAGVVPREAFPDLPTDR